MSVSIQGQFQRSINLTRDFYGDHDLGGYVVTTKVRELLERMTASLEAPVAQRAWSVTGPYGGGKSAFALYAAHLLRGSEDARARLFEADPDLTERMDEAVAGVFCPVLIVGSRESLGTSLMRGLASSLSYFVAHYNRQRGRPSKEVQDLREALHAIADEAKGMADQADDEVIVSLYQRAAAVVQEATGGGLLLVVDELGKLLEYAALYPDRSDLYVLQRLAERASRTGDTPEEAAPMLVLTILHQSFDRYAGRLTTLQRDEWRKVQGRYEDFGFVEPVNETLRLLARAVVVDDPAVLPEGGEDLVEAVLAGTQLPQHIDPVLVKEHLLGALPLHPSVSLLVGPLFRRLAQNERSLFAFLASGERDSFLDVLRQTVPDLQSPSLFSTVSAFPYYRLDHLYDYLVGTLGATLYHENMGKLWAETEAALSSLRKAGELETRLIKQIALLSFAGGLAGLRPTAEFLKATAEADPKAVEVALERLKTKRVVIFRPFKGEYHIWQGSDFDLEEQLREARQHIQVRMPLADMLSEVLPPGPMVARRHSYRTGTVRVFEVGYTSDETWQAALQKPHRRADGRILYVLPEHDGDTAGLVESLKETSQDDMTLMAVPDGLASLREVVRELRCLEWVRQHAKELEGDAVARREVDEQYADLSGYVQQRLANLLVTDEQGCNPCMWVYQGETFRLLNERALQEKLSHIADSVFAKSPEIWNELLNRRKPSPSANRGLKLLLDAMIVNPEKARLGIEGHPAEYGMYASILQATGMHRAAEQGGWCFAKPDPEKRPGCVAVWDAIESVLREARGRRISVETIYDMLSQPPFGVRKGLLPVFLFAFYMHGEDDIAVYENGSFVQKVDFETIERLLKSPDKFALQLVEITGALAEVLRSLAPIVGLPTSLQQPLPFVIRLLRTIHGLPPYVRKTASLSTVALAVREALQNAVEPTTLLFEELPEACEMPSFLLNTEAPIEVVHRFFEHLQESLRELIGAYDALLGNIQDQIAGVFRLHTGTPEDRRHELAERAQPVLWLAADTKLKTFLVRATDEVYDTQGWYESLAGLLARRPPVQWGDEDLEIFRTALREVARRFYTLEPIAFEAQKDQEETVSRKAVSGKQTIKRIRLGVTSLHEDEREAVINVHPEDSELVDQVYDRLQGTLSQYGESLETKLAALGKLTLDLLRQRDNAFSDIKESHE